MFEEFFYLQYIRYLKFLLFPELYLNHYKILDISPTPDHLNSRENYWPNQLWLAALSIFIIVKGLLITRPDLFLFVKTRQSYSWQLRWVSIHESIKFFLSTVNPCYPPQDTFIHDEAFRALTWAPSVSNWQTMNRPLTSTQSSSASLTPHLPLLNCSTHALWI